MILHRKSHDDVNLRTGIVVPSQQGDLLLNLTVILWLSNSALKSFIHPVLAPFGVQGATMLVAGLITFLPVVLYVVSQRKLPGRHFYWIYLLVATYFIATAVAHPQISTWFSREIFGVSYTVFRPDHGAIWAVLIVEISRSPQRLWANLKIVATITFLHNMYLAYGVWRRGYWTYVSSTGQVAERSYDLDFGYNMIFVVIVFLAWAYYERRWLLIAPSIIASLLVLQYGSRGALLCLVVFLLLATQISDDNRVVRLFRVGVATTIFGLLAIYWEKIAQSGAQFLRDRLGFESRTLDAILFNQATDDSGRDGIYSIIKEALAENPLGYGAYGDRPFVGPSYYWGYAHNIYYEMAMNFGVVLAAILIALILGFTIKRFFQTRDMHLQLVIAVVLAMCMRLTVSDTFWGNNFFWILIGILITFRGQRRSVRTEEPQVTTKSK